MEARPAEGQDRKWIFFPHKVVQRTTQWERGSDPLTTFTFTGDYDAFGQPRAETQVACPRGWRPGATSHAYLATRTRTTYAFPDDPTVYIRDRVAATTTYEIRNSIRQGGDEAPIARTIDEIAALAGTHESLQVIGQTLSYSDGLAFEGLPFGHVGAHGALVRTESLTLTDEVIAAVYGAERPPYLSNDSTVPWAVDYPGKFRSRVPALAGYVYRQGEADLPCVPGFYVAGERRRYDFHDDPSGRGLITATRDPLGHETTIVYDGFALLPTMVTDPAGLTTTAEYDQRMLQPRLVTDPNGNQTRVAYTPLGLLEATWASGKGGQGDREQPGVTMHYDFLAFTQAQQPISVRSVRRTHHDTDTDVALPERDETITTLEYSDGFGRLLQTRTQAEDDILGDATFGGGVLPANQRQFEDARRAVVEQRRGDGLPNVVVSGWQIYDNKGRVVEKYEPFFTMGWAYMPPTNGQLGQKITMFYDPRGQVVRIVNPDSSEQRVVDGVPADLSALEDFAPTPWEAYTYDANDNAERTHPRQSGSYQQHWNTPSSIEIDGLGRTVRAITRNGPDGANEWYVTRSTYDIRGNLLTVTDALGRVAFTHDYDLANRPLRIDSVDAGTRLRVYDAAGNLVEARDGKGALDLRAYDALNRPLGLWARDAAGEPVTLRERLIYGDDPQSGLSPEEARARNLLGRLYRHDDEAGRLVCESYDFKGNLTEKSRQVIGDAALLAAWTPAQDDQAGVLRVDWDAAGAEQLLEGDKHCTTTSYDALSHVTAIRYPEDASGKRALLRPRYNRAGALERVELDGAVYVERIAYNAKGQRTLIAYGNNLMTRYAYDEHTFRLARLRTERYTRPSELSYQPDSGVLLDYAYAYDLAGNILTITDRVPGSGIPGNPEAARYAGSDPQLAQELTRGDALVRAFGYDPLYRLVAATGREHATPAPAPPWLDVIRPPDPTKTRRYEQRYAYDAVGNILQIGHVAQDNTFSRDVALGPGSNRLQSVTIGKARYVYQYDANGNLLRENGERRYEWDHADRLRSFHVQPEGAEPSIHAQYLYDAAGQRVKKLVRRQGGAYEVTVYIDGIFEQHRRVQGSEVQENNTLHVMDNQSRIALVRVGAPFPGDESPAVQYQLGDHLGSGALVIDGDGTWISREEFYPYGETSYGGYARKRYRFTGKERDEESGLSYHGARYYAPWLGRWASCDPAGMVDGVNVQAYGLNNPMRFIDDKGMEAGDSSDWAKDYNNLSPEQRMKYNYDQAQRQKIELDKSPEGPQKRMLLRGGVSPNAEPRKELPQFIEAGAGLLGSGARYALGKLAYKPNWSYGKLPKGWLGKTSKYGKITIQPGLSGSELRETLRHETVHSFLSPRSGPFMEARADLRLWCYQNSHLLKYLEEAAAEAYGKNSISYGLRYPFLAEYGLSKGRVALEAAGYVGGVGAASYGAYKLTE